MKKLFSQMAIMLVSIITFVSGVTTIVFAFSTFMFVGDALTDDCYDNYKGHDYYYNGTNTFLLSLILLAVSIIVFVIASKVLLHEPKVEGEVSEDIGEKRFRHRLNSGLTGRDLTEGLYD